VSINSKIKNPCIHVCTKDEKGICLGCYRSPEEIGAWYKCDDNQKKGIIALADARRIEYGKNNFYT
jgi:predicted Fe-S protein YdhL (DUF1289 family)